MQTIETDRLRLRKWIATDIMPMVLLNQDPRVMEYFPGLVSEKDTRLMIENIESHFEKHGFGFYAVEHKETKDFIGFVGVNSPDFDAPFMPAIEIGWRLAFNYWGYGYATEAAKAVVEYTFNHLKLASLVSFTVPHNRPSRHVMEKLGMTHNPLENFHHPKLPKDHPLSLHVLYRLTKDQYKSYKG